MGMPWDAQQMQPDIVVPVVARNPKTGQEVRVDVSENLRQAIKAAINDTVMGTKTELEAEHPKAGRLAEVMLQGSAIDLAVAAVAVVATIIWPTSAVTGVLWIVTAALAAKTVTMAAIDKART
jgi:predicted anti-sigma-YlaC factor YlaD